MILSIALKKWIVVLLLIFIIEHWIQIYSTVLTEMDIELPISCSKFEGMISVVSVGLSNFVNVHYGNLSQIVNNRIQLFTRADTIQLEVDFAKRIKIQDGNSFTTIRQFTPYNQTNRYAYYCVSELCKGVSNSGFCQILVEKEFCPQISNIKIQDDSFFGQEYDVDFDAFFTSNKYFEQEPKTKFKFGTIPSARYLVIKNGMNSEFILTTPHSKLFIQGRNTSVCLHHFCNGKLNDCIISVSKRYTDTFTLPFVLQLANGYWSRYNPNNILNNTACLINNRDCKTNSNQYNQVIVDDPYADFIQVRFPNQTAVLENNPSLLNKQDRQDANWYRFDIKEVCKNFNPCTIKFYVN